MLLYGCGLRISEALGLKRGDAPIGATDAIRVVGKGGRERIVPVLPAVRRAVESLYRARARSRLSRTSRSFAARAAGRSRRGSCSSRSRGCAARSGLRRASRRMRSAIPSPRISSAAAATSAQSRSFSATPACRRRRSTRASMPRGCSTSTGRRIQEPELLALILSVHRFLNGAGFPHRREGRSIALLRASSTGGLDAEAPHRPCCGVGACALRLRRAGLRFHATVTASVPAEEVVAMSTVDDATTPVVIATDSDEGGGQTECPAGETNCAPARQVDSLLRVLMLRRTPALGPAFVFRRPSTGWLVRSAAALL